MNESTLQETLEDFFNSMGCDPDIKIEDIVNAPSFENVDCRTYREAMMMTDDKGILIRINGEEFAITIQKR